MLFYTPGSVRFLSRFFCFSSLRMPLTRFRKAKKKKKKKRHRKKIIIRRIRLERKYLISAAIYEGELKWQGSSTRVEKNCEQPKALKKEKTGIVCTLAAGQKRLPGVIFNYCSNFFYRLRYIINILNYPNTKKKKKNDKYTRSSINQRFTYVSR